MRTAFRVSWPGTARIRTDIVMNEDPSVREKTASRGADGSAAAQLKGRALTPPHPRLGLPLRYIKPLGTSHFPTTRWTGVLGLLGKDDLNLRKEALANLCRDYWYPLYAFARRLGRSKVDAEDLTQGFFIYAIEHEVFNMADRNLGTLRTFLLKVFQRYISGVWDRDNALKRGGGQNLVSLDLESGEELYASSLLTSDTPELFFDRSWAQSLLRLSLSALAANEQSAGRGQIFAHLQAFLTPESVAEQCYEATARELGLTPESVRQAVSRLRRKFRECLRDQIAATLHEPDDARIDTELCALKVALRA